MSSTAFSFPSPNRCDQCRSYKNCPVRHIETALKSRLSGPTLKQYLLHKGDQLYTPGQEFQSLYIVKSGSFKTALYDEAGNLQITGFHYASDLLGIDGIQTGRYQYETQALETATLCALPYPDSNSLNSLPAVGVLQQITTEMSRQLFQSSHWFLSLSKLRADQRLARFLLIQSRKLAARGCSPLKIPLTMPRHNIANYLGIADETASRLFKRFEESAWIKAERRWVELLDIESLRRLADGEYAALSSPAVLKRLPTAASDDYPLRRAAVRMASFS